MANPDGLLETALTLARQGERVLPLWWTDDTGVCACWKGNACSSPGKHPRTEHGKDDATVDERLIARWWREWPLANLGQRTDRIHRFDIDDVEVARTLASEGSLAVFTEANRTPRPGLHVSFIPKEPFPTQDLYLTDGRRLGELRGLDAYVVVPPSRIGMRRYERLSPADVCPIRLDDPLAWLAGLLKEHDYQLAPKPVQREYTRLTGTIHEGAGRHNALVSLAGRMFIDGMSEEAFLGAIEAINQAQCSPPLPFDEVEAIVRHFVEHRQPLAGSSHIHSAVLKEEVPAERMARPIRFRTAAELEASTASGVEWIVRPWVAKESLTEVDGKAKMSGKTTFLTFVARSVLDGEPFMGEPTMKTKVVYLTEQGDTSFREALRRAGLLGREDLLILAWKDVASLPWPAVVEAVTAKCLEFGAGLLIVDTLPQFAGIEGEGENSSGAALQAMRPLQLAAAQNGLGVIFSRHERKSGGDVGDSGRGSSAFAGSADIIISLRRPSGYSGANVREILAIGRFDETPASLAIELTERGFESRGTGRALAVNRARTALEEHLPRDEAAAMTLEELVNVTGIGRTSVQDALEAMREEGLVSRTGKGAKGSAYRFWRC